DAVEVPRKALCLDQRLTPTGGTAMEIGVLRRLRIVTLRDCLTRDRHHVGPAVREVDLALKIVIGPQPVLTLTHVAHVRCDAGITSVQWAPPEPEGRISAGPAAAELYELAIPTLERQSHGEADGGLDIAFRVAVRRPVGSS